MAQGDVSQWRTPLAEMIHAGTTMFEDVAQTQAIKRTAYPNDLEAAISFLATEDARWVTGQSIVVDGGSVRH